MIRPAGIRAALAGLATALALGGCTSAPAASAPSAAFVVDDAAVNQARYECLIDKGFAVTRGDGGAVVFIDPKDEQFDGYRTALRACEQQLADRGLLPEAHSGDLRRVYALMAAAHACLMAKGFPLNAWMGEDNYVDTGGEANLLDADRPIDPAAARDACPTEFAALEAAS
ncbi:MAG: hypothetical protein ACOH1Y_11240 [Propionicimonas sp.]